MALFHPQCAPNERVPTDFCYAKNPSSKLDAFMKIVKHHLAERGRGPLTNAGTLDDPNCLRYAEEVTRPEGTEAVPDPTMPCDKIVAFVMFPENMTPLRCMLEEAHVEWEEYIGTVPAARRANRLEHFRTSKTCHVLLVSKIGATGLNLAFARVLVIVVSTFTPSFGICLHRII